MAKYVWVDHKTAGPGDGLSLRKEGTVGCALLETDQSFTCLVPSLTSS
jgi:hypothetical protein